MFSFRPYYDTGPKHGWQEICRLHGLGIRKSTCNFDRKAVGVKFLFIYLKEFHWERKTFGFRNRMVFEALRQGNSPPFFDLSWFGEGQKQFICSIFLPCWKNESDLMVQRNMPFGANQKKSGSFFQNIFRIPNPYSPLRISGLYCYRFFQPK